MESPYPRKNTIKAAFDKSTTRPSALDIHRWAVKQLEINVDQVEALQLIGPENAVYIKLVSQSLYEKILLQHEGTHAVTLSSGIQTTVTVSEGGGELQNVRVFNVPLEVPDEKISQALNGYGKVHKIHRERWSSGYELQVNNGIRMVRIKLAKPIPSNINISGCKAYITYPGQEQTCYNCNEISHLTKNCPNKATRLGKGTPPKQVLKVSDLFKTPTINNQQNVSTPSPSISDSTLNNEIDRSLVTTEKPDVMLIDENNTSPVCTLQQKHIQDTELEHASKKLKTNTETDSHYTEDDQQIAMELSTTELLCEPNKQTSVKTPNLNKVSEETMRKSKEAIQLGKRIEDGNRKAQKKLYIPNTVSLTRHRSSSVTPNNITPEEPHNTRKTDSAPSGITTIGTAET